MVNIIGIPLDENSSYLRGPARAPASIREALHCGSSNLCVEDGRDLAAFARIMEAGQVLQSAAELRAESKE